MASIDSAKSLRTLLRKKSAGAESLRSKRNAALQQRMKSAGLVGMRMGKHKVEDAPVDVQIGEELSETLRAMKVSNFDIGQISNITNHITLA